MSVDAATGIWSLDIAKRRHKCDFMLAAAMGEMFEPMRAADLGCGDGRYCAIFRAYGWPTVCGYEGTCDVMSLGVYDNIYEVDLTKVLEHVPSYDFVLCLEVGEHVPQKHEQIFIDNVCNFASKDLVLSWGVPGQYSASGHINLRGNDFVAAEFLKRGLQYDHEKTWKLRDAAFFLWFKRSLMVFHYDR